MLRVVDQISKTEVVFGIRYRLSANLAPPIGGVSSPLCFLNAALSFLGQRVTSKCIDMNDCVAEHMQGISLVRNERREGDCRFGRLNRAPANRTTHTRNKNCHGYGPKRMIWPAPSST